ncbi:MAG: porin [Aquabacterium sp.]|uniref:porin n=1 Tax=Aquabacterium sp. TaxID=1872578 RepID=UPI0025BAD1FF|nr:porin [Aquabacterium sp.]MBI5926856.1 porin [Aquabacterium sp.]
MQKTVLTKAVAVALATLGAGAAFAQSSVTIYGNLDVAVDSVHKGQGDVAASTLFSTLAANSASFNSGFVAKSSVTRVTSSISSVNALGFKGTEDIGGGYKAGFVLEGQFQLDTGAQSGQDGRMWGRQAFVGLTTPYGEVRLGRQYAPMFYAFATATVEALGGADIMGSGLIVNNLQVRQDNQVSYWLKAGDLTAALSFSPNAGVDRYLSSTRMPTTVNSGSAGSTAGSNTGQIAGGASAGTESADTGGRGRSVGVYLNYNVDPALMVNFGYHNNKFGNATLITGSGSALYTPLAELDKYSAYSLGAKYVVPGAGTQLAGIYHLGKFSNDSGQVGGPKISTLALGVKHPIDKFAVGAEFAYSKFTNFTKGKDTSLMLMGDYNFSKRTKVYLRAGYVKDSAGDAAATGSGVNVVGGPLPLLTGFGSVETPFFSAAGANIDATTRVVAVGIRHQF